MLLRPQHVLVSRAKPLKRLKKKPSKGSSKAQATIMPTQLAFLPITTAFPRDSALGKLTVDPNISEHITSADPASVPNSHSQQSGKKSTPSRDHRKLSRFFDRLSDEQIQACREHVTAIEISSSQLEYSLTHPVARHEEAASDVHTAFLGLSDQVSARGIDVLSSTDGKPSYKNGTEQEEQEGEVAGTFMQA